MSVRRVSRLLAGVVTVGLVAGPLAGAAAASGTGRHQLPFACGQDWTGVTRARHQPSADSIDFNRADDLGRLVLASASGLVTRVEDAGARSYGRWIEVRHLDGSSTVYAHLKVQWVVPGQYVDQGTPLGRVGATGGVSGPHLHYEQRLGRDVVPAAFGGLPFTDALPQRSGNCADVPLAGDWDGDRVEEAAVFRREAGRGRFELATPAGATLLQFGRATDLPVIGDWDGDGVADVGVRRQGTRAFLMRVGDGTVLRQKLGRRADVPVTGDWDGSGTTDVGVWRPGEARFRLLMPDGRHRVVRLGDPSSQPVTGDWNGDRVTDLGVYDASDATFRLRTVARDGRVVVTAVPLGLAGDLPVTGDWDGNGVTDLGTWAPATATYTLRISPRLVVRRAGSTPELRTLVLGRPR